LEWDKISADRDVFTRWMKENVLDSNPDVFAARVKGL
ncbi:MAG: 3-oxoadipate--succinyl-CoA transferase subunit, partial [Microvirga sp.]|nr:3-oxoadipate--succinyl-CoA transferase subunit [Microvirga sp.]